MNPFICGVAVPTVLDASGAVDTIAQRKFVTWVTLRGATSVLVAGTTGRGSTLNSLQRIELVKAAAGLAPVLCGVSITSSADDLKALREAGASYALAAPVSGTTDELLSFIKNASASGMSPVAYHHPEHYTALSRELWPTLLTHNVLTKVSCSDAEYLTDAMAYGLSVVIGASKLMFGSKFTRAQGVLSGAASVMPESVWAATEGNHVEWHSVLDWEAGHAGARIIAIEQHAKHASSLM